ncbi:MAG: WhiB redox-sensing transcription factor [Candidatus Saccharibacteria bacterium]|nr:WhiB redox-sensing transcription factor [Candidatus Saccharibacteria bacterium]
MLSDEKILFKEAIAIDPLEVVIDPEARDQLEAGVGWQKLRACNGADPELFFSPDQKDGRPTATQREAMKWCADCIVKQACLQFALVNDEVAGVWGGLTTFQRRNLGRRHVA